MNLSRSGIKIFAEDLDVANYVLINAGLGDYDKATSVNARTAERLRQLSELLECDHERNGRCEMSSRKNSAF